MSMYFPNLDELSFRTVLAFPKANGNMEINYHRSKQLHYISSETNNTVLNSEDNSTMKRWSQKRYDIHDSKYLHLFLINKCIRLTFKNKFESIFHNLKPKINSVGKTKE